MTTALEQMVNLTHEEKVNFVKEVEKKYKGYTYTKENIDDIRISEYKGVPYYYATFKKDTSYGSKKFQINSNDLNSPYGIEVCFNKVADLKAFLAED